MITFTIILILFILAFIGGGIVFVSNIKNPWIALIVNLFIKQNPKEVIVKKKK